MNSECNKNEVPSIGILTIIGSELRAVKSALGFTEADRVTVGDGTLSYAKTIETDFNGPVRVLLWGIGSAGNSAAAADSAKLIGKKIKFLILCGIAAGLRGKVKIGDVVIPRAVVDNSLQVVEDGQYKPRPVITGLLRGVCQMNAAVEIEAKAIHTRFSELAPKKIKVPSGQEDEYVKYVAEKPDIHESAILSGNLLVRDPSVVVDAANDLHQQIRAADMEAGGFVHACMNEYPPIPWFVIRGISDFGDTFKNDLFHEHASKAVAAYLSLYLRHVIDLKIWHKLEQSEKPTNGAPTMFLKDIVEQVERVANEGTSSELPALNKAFTITFAYLSQLSQPDSAIDPGTRIQLSLLWHNAANEVKEFDPTLYEICFKKRGYWIDPSRWDETAIKAGGFSYSQLLEKLQSVGFAKAPAATVDWRYSVEFDDKSLDGHIFLESVAGQGLNGAAPPAMNSWEIDKTIADCMSTAKIMEKVPSFLLGGITVRVNEGLYRKWRRKEFVLVDAKNVGADSTTVGELPIGIRTVEGLFKPSDWRKISESFESEETFCLDVEMPDGSLSALSGRIKTLEIKEQRPDGLVDARLLYDVETSERLFAKFKCYKRLLCHGAPLQNIKETLADALSENGWVGPYGAIGETSIFRKEVEVVDNEKKLKVLFEACIKIECNGWKTVIKLEVAERVLYSLKGEVQTLAKNLELSINNLLH